MRRQTKVQKQICAAASPIPDDLTQTNNISTAMLSPYVLNISAFLDENAYMCFVIFISNNNQILPIITCEEL